MGQPMKALEVPQPRLRPITEVGTEFGLLESELISYGPYKAKISLDALKRLENRPDGRLLVVTAITPTRAGEGKTTSAISLTQGLGRIWTNVALCLRQRIGRIIVAQRKDGSFVTAEDLRVAGGMTVLLKGALLPNIVQTMDGQPALVHAGPFGNIAHGNNSLLADQIALKLADVVVTEAGFGADLGLEKFAHIVARYGHLRPAAALIVATVRALKSHGGVPIAKLGNEDLDALKRGSENLAAHIDIVRAFGMRSVVGVNRFPSDTERELELLAGLARQLGADAAVLNAGFSHGGGGGG